MSEKSGSWISRMSPRGFELLCVVMLGFGHLCIMTGCDSQAFILESVIHSIHERDPGRINSHAGYYGQATCYLAFVITCLVSPSILYATSAKTTLFIASVCFTSFPLGFLYTNQYYYFFSAALNGVGFALYYTGNGGYLTSHSTRNTIESNVSISWAIGSSCMIVGAGIIALITYLTAGQAPATMDILNSTLNSTVSAQHFERRFSDMEIYLLFSVFALISFIGNVTFLLMPSSDIDNCIESSQKTVAFRDGIHLMYRAFRSPKMFILIPMFMLTGVHTSFWVSIYPTTLTFNSHLAKMIYLPAIYSLGVGLGETIMGMLISFCSKRIPNFGMRPTMFIGCFLTIMYCGLIVISTPASSPMAPTSEKPLLFQPTRLLVFVIALIGGMSDCCLCSVRSVICAINMPNRRDQAFSVSKFYQSIGTCVVFFISPFLNIYYYTIGIPILCVIASFCFFFETRRIKRMEKTMTNMELDQAEQRKKSSKYETLDEEF
uniref:Membrane transporter n=2 Tax=Caenorhabditis japonica TaxID=281687 RepID=A0A8R1HI55_CAEJA